VTLPTREEAVRFNESLPCTGEIVDLAVEETQVTATFVLGDRQAGPCDAPGEQASAIIVVESGKIVVWQQVPVLGEDTPVPAPPAADEPTA
jgi:hypothetical protein